VGRAGDAAGRGRPGGAAGRGSVLSVAGPGRVGGRMGRRDGAEGGTGWEGGRAGGVLAAWCGWFGGLAVRWLASFGGTEASGETCTVRFHGLADWPTVGCYVAGVVGSRFTIHHQTGGEIDARMNRPICSVATCGSV
jgi:hypothetical protein